MEATSSVFDAFDDDVTLSDDTYAEVLQLQEALEASLSIAVSSSNIASTSSPEQISCEICTEDKPESDMLRFEGCPHSFCSNCISEHVKYKLQHRTIPISCPDEGCDNIIQPSSLSSVVDRDDIAKWEAAIAESTIDLSSRRIYCPTCEEILVDDDGDNINVTRITCPWCSRVLCAVCKVPWHEGVDCEEFKRSNRNEEKLRLLAEEKKWKECPNCEALVDKTDGCIHMTCRCKVEFCYVCGLKWDESHWDTCLEK